MIICTRTSKHTNKATLENSDVAAEGESVHDVGVHVPTVTEKESLRKLSPKEGD